MDKQQFKNIIEDLGCLTLLPRRYGTPQGKTREFWGEVSRKYGNVMKAVRCSDYHWRVIEYNDGHRELAYIRILKGSMFSGMYPALFRGLIPHRISLGTFASIKDIRLAF